MVWLLNVVVDKQEVQDILGTLHCVLENGADLYVNELLLFLRSLYRSHLLIALQSKESILPILMVLYRDGGM